MTNDSGDRSTLAAPNSNDLQQPMTAKRSWRNDSSQRAWVVCAIAVLASVPLVALNQGFVRDDWSHYVNMRDLHESLPPWEAILRIASNEWFGAHEVRVFFGSFLVHYVISVFGNLAPLFAYLWIALLHASAGLLIGFIVWRVTRLQLLAIAVALAVTYFPPAFQAAIWVNNLFFVQPWFFYLAMISTMLLRSMPFGWRVTVVTIFGLAAAASGEPAIPLVLGSAVVWPIALRLTGQRWLPVAIACIPFTAILVLLCTYLAWIIPGRGNAGFELARLTGFGEYLSGAYRQFIGLLSPRSEYYGYQSVSWTLGAALVAVLLVSLCVLALLIAAGDTKSLDVRRMTLLLVASLAAFAASLVPWALGVLSGARLGPDLRYLYIPSSIAVVAILSLGYCTVRLLLPRDSVLIRVGFVGICAASVLLSVYNICVVWGSQRAVDQRIWSLIEAELSADTVAVVTFNPNHPYLMAPYHSGAISDFQADWGVAGRLAWRQREGNRLLIFRDANRDGSTLQLRPYYSNDIECVSLAGSGMRNDIIYVAFDYGVNLEALATSPLLVTTDVDAFQEFKTRMAPPWDPTSSAFAWPPC